VAGLRPGPKSDLRSARGLYLAGRRAWFQLRRDPGTV
jgi:hypothetical protein